MPSRDPSRPRLYTHQERGHYSLWAQAQNIYPYQHRLFHRTPSNPFENTWPRNSQTNSRQEAAVQRPTNAESAETLAARTPRTRS